jgi:hypothetical protein
MKTVVAGALGECVHVAGVLNFLRLAEASGWRTVFLGPAVPVETFLEAVRREVAHRSTDTVEATSENAEPTEILVGVSYRMTPETGERLLAEFAEEADELRSAGVRFVFGGTPPMVERARAMGFFERSFDGDTSAEVLAFLKGQDSAAFVAHDFPQTTIARIEWKAPFPILRHHFGLPTVEATKEGIARIAEAKVLDVVSLGVDQDAQANFFRPERQNPRRRGAGGVPVRNAEHYQALHRASRRGNYPLLRTYSGTDDFLRLAQMYVDTINIAWCAIPLFWFNQMDGRGPWDLEGSIREHQKVMAWYGERRIPVELNEPHHWGMRDAPDVVFIVSAFLSAYNARAFGVRDYIAQMMFNSPPGMSDRMDLAKMLALLELIEPLAGPGFRIWRQTRTGLLSYPIDADAARAHLAASIYLQMAARPHIVHVVGHTEAHHAATPDDVIEACKAAQRVIENSLRGQPDMTADPAIQQRKRELITEARVLLEGVRSLAGAEVRDPLVDPPTLARAVQTGLLDAPHLRDNPAAWGRIVTRIDERGACVAVDPVSGQALSEQERISRLSLRHESDERTPLS